MPYEGWYSVIEKCQLDNNMMHEIEGETGHIDRERSAEAGVPTPPLPRGALRNLRLPTPQDLRAFEREGIEYVQSSVGVAPRASGVRWAFYMPYEANYPLSVEQTCRVSRDMIDEERRNMDPRTARHLSKAATTIIRHAQKGFTFDQLLTMTITSMLEHFR